MVKLLLLLLASQAHAANQSADNFLAYSSFQCFDPGNRSRKVTIQSPTLASSWTMTLPTSGGTNGYALTTNGSGVTSWSAVQSPLTLGNLTDAGTDGITVTGGTGAVIGSGTSLSQHVADSTHNGYLSSTDWSTFNSKFSLPSLTAGSVLFSNGTTIAQDNANFYYDSTNVRLKIGSTSGTGRLEVTNTDDTIRGNLVLWGQGRAARSEWLIYDSPIGDISMYNPDQTVYGWSCRSGGGCSFGTYSLGAANMMLGIKNNAGELTKSTLAMELIPSQTGDFITGYANGQGSTLFSVSAAGKGFFTGLRNTALGAGVLRSNSSGDQSAAEISGDCTTSGSNAITCTKTNGTSFGTLATKSTTGSSILYGDGAGGISNVTIGSGLSFSGGTLSASGGSGCAAPVLTKTGDYTVTTSDFTCANKVLIVEANCSSSCSITFPPASNSGFEIDLINVGTATAAAVLAGSDTFGSTADQTWVLPAGGNPQSSNIFKANGGSRWNGF